MRPEDLWVICDMLSEPDKAEVALTELEMWLAPPAEDDLGSDSTIFIGPSPTERLLRDLDREGVSKPEQVKIIGTMTGNLTDLLKSDDADLARRAGTVLMRLAQVSAKLVGSEAADMPTQREANRALGLLYYMTRTLGPDLGLQPVGETPRARRRPGNHEGGIFSGSIFGDDEDDF